MQTSIATLLKFGAPVIGMLAGGLSIYNVLKDEAPAIAIGQVAIKENRDVTLDRIMRAGGNAKVDPNMIQSDDSVQMTTLAYVLIWRENLRDDCIFAERSIFFVNDVGESIQVFRYTGLLPQGDKGQRLDVVKIPVPSDVTPGFYAIKSIETYRCHDAVQVFRFPDRPVNVQVAY